MKNFTATLDGIRNRAAMQNITARDLSAVEKTAAVLSQTKDAELRRQFSETLELLRLCGILSRTDSHHWDRGLCELEFSEEVICIAEGSVLCFDGETAMAYSSDEVREIGGAKF